MQNADASLTQSKNSTYVYIHITHSLKLMKAITS